MPKRNTLPSIPDYMGIGTNPEKLTVQKSNPLLTLSETSITLPELKILDVYLSRINSHEPEKRYVQLEKGELEKILGVTRILQKDLDERINNLFQVVTIKDDTKRNGFTKISLFEKVTCEQDENGLWQIDLMCTQSAMEYIFNIENLGYLKYRLRNIVNFTSRRSYFLYLYLEDNIYRKTFEVDLNELKQILDCTAVTYLEFKEFNKQILKKAQKEILKNTDLSFTYSTIRKNRKVAIIVFEVERVKRPEEIFTEKKSVPEQLPEKQQEFIPSITEQIKPELKQEVSITGNIQKRTMETDFTSEQIEDLCDMLESKLDNDDPVHIRKVLQGLYANMKLSAKSKINDRMAYLKTIIKNLETEPSKEKSNQEYKSDTDKYNFVINNI